MNRLAVVSGIYGGHDYPKPMTSPLATFDYLMFTDDPDLRVDGWQTIYDASHEGLHPRLAAKWPKFFQDDRLRRYDAIVWIDGSIQILKPRFPLWVLSLAGGGMAQFMHPPASGGRDCIYDEAVVCQNMQKYRNVSLLRQAEHYREEGHPPHWGMWATGVIAWGSIELAKIIGSDWWAENCAWTYHDQLSEPVVLRRNGVRPATIPGDLFHHPSIQWTDHKYQH